MGHVSEAFAQEHLDRLRGASAIGHVRYSSAGEVAILEAHPSLPLLAGHENMLSLESRNLARGRIAHVTNCTGAAQAIEMLLRESFGNVSHFALLPEFDAVGCDDATRLLPAVLQRIQTQVSQARGVRMTVNPEDATLFSQLADLDFCQLSCPTLRFVVEIFSTIHKTIDRCRIV